MAKKGLEYLLSPTKRTLDVVGATALSTVLFVPGIGVAAASAIDTWDNPLVVQPRVGGQGEEEFDVYKFRSIAESRNRANPRRTYGTYHPGASRFGRTLRKYGADELPQLINVLNGSMSLVGPRPLLAEDLERNQAAAPTIFDEWYSYFKVVKPGLIGESQLYRRHYQDGVEDSVVAKSMEMDLRYFETATLLGEVALLRTAPAGILRANSGVIDNQQDRPTDDY